MPSLEAVRDKEIEDLKDEVSRLTTALEASVRLQSHYAGLLNIYDQGQRMQFKSVEAWLKRLEKTGTLERRS
jgi:hypothetical protein